MSDSKAAQTNDGHLGYTDTLIWRRATYFVQNSTTNMLPGDTRRVKSESPDALGATDFRRQIKRLETQNFSYFSLFTISVAFEVIVFFMLILNTVSSEKSFPTSKPFLLTNIDIDNSFPRPCWILIGQFKLINKSLYYSVKVFSATVLINDTEMSKQIL